MASDDTSDAYDLASCRLYSSSQYPADDPKPERFIIPSEILNVTSKVLDQPDNSILHRLPTELFCMIFQGLEHAPYQISLSLTCKSFGQVALTQDLAVSENVDVGQSGYRVDLAVTLKDWMPKTVWLCKVCYHFKPLEGEFPHILQKKFYHLRFDGALKTPFTKWYNAKRTLGEGNPGLDICLDCWSICEQRIFFFGHEDVNQGLGCESEESVCDCDPQDCPGK